MNKRKLNEMNSSKNLNNKFKYTAFLMSNNKSLVFHKILFPLDITLLFF